MTMTHPLLLASLKEMENSAFSIRTKEISKSFGTPKTKLTWSKLAKLLTNGLKIRSMRPTRYQPRGKQSNQSGSGNSTQNWRRSSLVQPNLLVGNPITGYWVQPPLDLHPLVYDYYRSSGCAPGYAVPAYTWAPTTTCNYPLTTTGYYATVANTAGTNAVWNTWNGYVTSEGIWTT